MNYFELLTKFLNIAQFRNFQASSRLTYLVLLHKWNALRQPKNFALSDRELSSLTGLGSNAITYAKRQLKNLGFIDFKASRLGTTYFFPENGNARFNARGNAQSETSGLLSTTYNKTNKKERFKNVREGEKNCETESQSFEVC